MARGRQCRGIALDQIVDRLDKLLGDELARVSAADEDDVGEATGSGPSRNGAGLVRARDVIEVDLHAGVLRVEGVDHLLNVRQVGSTGIRREV